MAMTVEQSKKALELEKLLNEEWVVNITMREHFLHIKLENGKTIEISAMSYLDVYISSD